ncbi:hypothetical protein LCGC14_2435500 [marine sediment metagenome]|uniref:Uncharacterized protein n=1 Tax=marine sediment metagenome TaxID=412755 RepID=A0A0F9EEL1_9ZZZZ
MKGWVRKEAALRATHSLMVKAYLAPWNVMVPCSVLPGRLKQLKAGHVFVMLYREDGLEFDLQVPEEAVSVAHPWLKYSIPLLALPAFRALQRDVRLYSAMMKEEPSG